MEPVFTELLDSLVPPKSSMQTAFTELLDPLVPVRGHGLITLRRLLDKGDPEALDNRQKLLEIFRENLAHADIYIYLAAIQGLASLGDKNPKLVLLPLLEVIIRYSFVSKLSRYSDSNTHNELTFFVN